MNRLHLLKPLIRSIEHSGDLKVYFSQSDLITYNYFVGRKAIFDNDLALGSLFVSCFIIINFLKFSRQVSVVCIQQLPDWVSKEQAFDSDLFGASENVFGPCAKTRVSWKLRLELFLWIGSCCQVSQFITQRVVGRLLTFWSSRDGNVKRLEEVMVEQEDFFIDSGIFLMLEKLKMTTFLNLVKLV